MTESTEPSDARVRQGRRLALIVATARYVDPDLRQLRAPSQDAEALGAVLADPDIGDFDVTPVVDATAQQIRLAVEDFTSDRRIDDLLVVFLSCHGLIDQRRRLYFAATDTVKQRLAATGIEAQWLLGQLDDCRARRQVVILDCCFSGAFASGAKGPGDDLGLGERFSGGGRGRVVLTASRATEYSFEGHPVAGSAMPGSVFTDALVRGITTGAADLDHDGYVSVDDAYGYVFDEIRASGAQQTPQRWLYGAEGEIYLARTPTDSEKPPARFADQGARPVLVNRQDGVSASVSHQWIRRHRLPAVLAAGLLVAAVAAAVLLNGLGSANESPSAQSTPTDTAPSTSAGPGTSGQFAASSPWRLSVRGGDSVGDGCVVDLTNRDTGSAWRTRRIYNSDVLQQHETGTVDWKVNDSRCIVSHLVGHGEQDLPLYQRITTSDTAAFQPGPRASVKVTDFDSNAACLLVLKDAESGDDIDSASATPSKPTVVLETFGHAWVYVPFSYCSLLISTQ